MTYKATEKAIYLLENLIHYQCGKKYHMEDLKQVQDALMGAFEAGCQTGAQRERSAITEDSKKGEPAGQ